MKNASDTSAAIDAAQMRLALDSAPMAAYLLDAEGVIRYVNGFVLNRFGWKPAELLDTSITDAMLFPMPFRSTLLSRLQNGDTVEEEGERLLSDGTTRFVRTRWESISEAQGEAAYLGWDEDVTERRLREQELEQARKLAKIGVLSEGIAHELRNPLSYALSAAQLLDDTRLTDDVRSQCIRTIDTGLRKAGLIVENLLSLGKPRTQFERRTVNLYEVVKEAVDAAATHPLYHAVEIRRRIGKDEAHVEGNHDMLVQVFHNVVTNALNELPDGGEIDITSERAKDGLRIHVTDTGPGVSEEQMRHLFDPFYTASASGNGTGLGLTLSYYIMKEHGGTIEVESRPGSGATFILHFPEEVSAA